MVTVTVTGDMTIMMTMTIIVTMVTMLRGGSLVSLAGYWLLIGGDGSHVCSGRESSVD